MKLFEKKSTIERKGLKKSRA